MCCFDIVSLFCRWFAPQVDAIVEAASLVTSLQTIIARNKDPLESGVVTCGTISGGYGMHGRGEATHNTRSFCCTNFMRIVLSQGTISLPTK
jgi:hypothetical protein